MKMYKPLEFGLNRGEVVSLHSGDRRSRVLLIP